MEVMFGILLEIPETTTHLPEVEVKLLKAAGSNAWRPAG